MRISDWSSDVCSSDLGDLDKRPRVVILNKTDVPEAAELAEMVTPEIEARGWPVFTISAVSREGLRPLTFALAKMVRDYREAHPKPEPKRQVIRPVKVKDSSFTIEKDPDIPGGFVVRGTRPRSEEHTSELQSLMRTSYAVF